MNINDLNTIRTTEASWKDFVNFSISSEFYKKTLQETGDIDEAVSYTLLNNYMNTFSPDEKVRLLKSREDFEIFAKGFIGILEEFRYSKKGYDKEGRAGFLNLIKNLLKAQKDKNGKIVDLEKYTFYYTIVRFCSSLEFILEIYDEFRHFLNTKQA